MSRSEADGGDAGKVAVALVLPAQAHLPGINARSEDDVLEQAKMLAPPQTRSQGWQENVAWLYGLRLIREGYYWEAHEVLETVWMHAPPNSREKALVQALIHGANARLKQRLGRSNAAARLVALSEEACERAYENNGAPLLGLSRAAALAFCARSEDERGGAGAVLAFGEM